MSEPIANLLMQRASLDAAVRARIEPLWPLIQEEMGVPADLRSAEGPLTVDLEGERLIFSVEARVAEFAGDKERRAARRVSIPVEAVDSGPVEVQRALRREFPLVCLKCGIFNRIDSRSCSSPAKCWGELAWRNESPQPEYYVESDAGYGYFAQGPRPRGLRYGIDLQARTIFGIEITLRHREHWYIPVEETIKEIVDSVSRTVGLHLNHAMRGDPSFHAHTSCLSYDPPQWCPDSAAGIRMPIVFPRHRALIA